VRAADLTNHVDRTGIRIAKKHFEDIDEFGADHLIARGASQLKRGSNLVRIRIGHAFGCRFPDGMDIFRRVVGDSIDVLAAFGRSDKRGLAGFAVDEDRQVKLTVDICTGLDVDPVVLFARGPACLVISVLPNISRTLTSASSAERETRTPPLPRPPA